jgi:type I restriction enzyme R subunit
VERRTTRAGFSQAAEANRRLYRRTAAPSPGPAPEPRREKIKVILADGKARNIQHMTATTFWSTDCRSMPAAQFLENLFGALPDFFRDKDQLRAIWRARGTRKVPLAGLAEKGFG